MVTLSAWSSRPELQLWPQVIAYCQRETQRHLSMQAFDRTHSASTLSEAFSGDPAVASKISTVVESMRTVACAASLRWPPCHCRVPKSSATAASRSRHCNTGHGLAMPQARKRHGDHTWIQSHARKASRQSTFSAAAKSTQTNFKVAAFWWLVTKTKYNGGRGSSAVVLGTISCFRQLTEIVGCSVLRYHWRTQQDNSHVSKLKWVARTPCRHA